MEESGEEEDVTISSSSSGTGVVDERLFIGITTRGDFVESEDCC
jgi:hypothetical protein